MFNIGLAGCADDGCILGESGAQSVSDTAPCPEREAAERRVHQSPRSEKRPDSRCFGSLGEYDSHRQMTET